MNRIGNRLLMRAIQSAVVCLGLCFVARDVAGQGSNELLPLAAKRKWELARRTPRLTHWT